MIRLSILSLGLLAAALSACAGPRPGPAPIAPPSGYVAGPAASPYPGPLVPQAGVPARPGGAFQAPAPGQAVRDQAAIAAACRQEADRIVVQRDRGQLLREDERDSRLGADVGAFGLRSQTDRLGRQFERDRIAEECIRANTRAAPDRPTGPAR